MPRAGRRAQRRTSRTSSSGSGECRTPTGHLALVLEMCRTEEAEVSYRDVRVRTAAAVIEAQLEQPVAGQTAPAIFATREAEKSMNVL
jgi:hypothetical protein